jgi:thiol-disulfide isomerase/thioredoxin
MNIRRSFLCAALLGLLAGAAGASETRDLKLPGGSEVPVRVHAAGGPLRAVWLPSGYNSMTAEIPVAAALAGKGVEVWQADVLEGRFLPPLESSLEQVPARDIAELIDQARADGRRVLFIATARAGILALQGIADWQEAHPREASTVAGAILLHPNLYVGPPEPGREAEYHAVVARNRAPVFIMQPEQSPWRWRLNATRAALERGGTPVYTRLITDVRDRYYFRPDATGSETEAAQRLGSMLRDAARLLAATPLAPVPAAPASKPSAAKPAAARGLQPYRGNPQPPPLALADLAGRSHTLSDWRGKVVLVNFWASWCPPCVHEMPSMQRLREKLAPRGFEVLAVNMAETDAEVQAFLREKVSVNFPILMDRNGEALRAWKVFVFPTSFVLDAQGQIRLGVFGEIDWEAPEVVRAIEALLPAR